MKICVISYGTITTGADGKFFINPVDTSLVNHLSTQHRVMYLAGMAEKDSSVYRNGRTIYTRVLSDQVDVIPLKSTSTQRLGHNLISFLSNMTVIYEKIRQCDLTYLYSPGYSSLSFGIISNLLVKQYILYIGCDWDEISRTQINGTYFRFLYHRIYKLGESYLYDRAAFILVAGNVLFEKVNRGNRKVFKIIPSTSFKTFSHPESKKNFSGKIHLLFVGPITPGKGIIYLVQALPLIQKNGVHVELHLVGAIHDSYKHILDVEIARENLKDSIKFYGYVSNKVQLMSIYASSHIFVTPTLAEGFPRVIYEAMIARLPVIATNIKSIKDNLDDEEQVYLIPPRNPQVISDAVSKIVHDQKLRQTMIKKGLQFVKERVNPKEHYEQVEELISQYIRS